MQRETTVAAQRALNLARPDFSFSIYEKKADAASFSTARLERVGVQSKWESCWLYFHSDALRNVGRALER